MNNFEDTFSRLKRVTQIRSQNDIARILNLNKATVSIWKKNKFFPPERIKTICNKFQIPELFDYVIAGKGDLSPIVNGGFDGSGEIPKTFAARLREARRRFGSMQDLANAVGGKAVTIQKWETNPPKRLECNFLKKIAKALDVSARYLLFGYESPETILNSENELFYKDPADAIDFYRRDPNVESRHTINVFKPSRCDEFDHMLAEYPNGITKYFKNQFNCIPKIKVRPDGWLPDWLHVKLTTIQMHGKDEPYIENRWVGDNEKCPAFYPEERKGDNKGEIITIVIIGERPKLFKNICLKNENIQIQIDKLKKKIINLEVTKEKI